MMNDRIGDSIIDYDSGPDCDGARDKPLNLFASLDHEQRKSMRQWWFAKLPVGSWWHHSSGRQYYIKDHANFFSDDWERYPPTIVYEGEDGHTWTRPAHDWMRSMTRNWVRSPGPQPINGRKP